MLHAVRHSKGSEALSARRRHDALINLEDDSVILDDDGSALIRNEATEPRDEWRGRKRVSV